MLVEYTGPTCPENCASTDLPAVAFNDCVDSMVIEESEIEEIYCTVPEDGAPLAKPTDWTTKAAWDAVVADTGTGKIRRLTVIADKPESESTVRVVSKGRKQQGPRTHTINFDIDDATQANYEFIRRLQCGSSLVIWYATKDFLYGGPDGFEVNVTKAGQILARGADSIALLAGQLQWTRKWDPPRIPNPMAVA